MNINDKISIGSNKGYLILKNGNEIKECSDVGDNLNSSACSSSNIEKKITPGDRYIFSNYEKVISKSKKKNKIKNKNGKSKKLSDCISIIRKIKNKNE